MSVAILSFGFFECHVVCVSPQLLGLIEQEVLSATRRSNDKLQCLTQTIQQLDRGIDFERSFETLEVGWSVFKWRFFHCTNTELITTNQRRLFSSNRLESGWWRREPRPYSPARRSQRKRFADNFICTLPFNYCNQFHSRIKGLFDSDFPLNIYNKQLIWSQKTIDAYKMDF